MKNFYFAVLCLLTIAVAHGQIPNASFESWSSGNPVGWGTSNLTGYPGVVQSNRAHAGSSAALMQVESIYSTAYPSTLNTGLNNDPYFNITSAPGALYGWYISKPVGNDVLSVTCSVMWQGYAQGYVNAELSDTTAVYKEFALDLSYGDVITSADSASISFILDNDGGLPNTGSYFIIDDLSFGAVGTGLQQVSEQPVLEECVPNPAKGTVNVIYSLPAPVTGVTVTLYDVLGHEVRTLLGNAQQSSGRYKIPVDVSALSAGVYICSLNANGQTYTQKLLVTK